MLSANPVVVKITKHENKSNRRACSNSHLNPLFGILLLVAIYFEIDNIFRLNRFDNPMNPIIKHRVIIKEINLSGLRLNTTYDHVHCV